MDKAGGRWSEPPWPIRHYLRLHLQWNAVFVRGRTLDIQGGAQHFKDLFKTDRYVRVGLPDARDPSDVSTSGSKLPFADGVFDSVLAIDGSEYAPELLLLLDEA